MIRALRPHAVAPLRAGGIAIVTTGFALWLAFVPVLARAGTEEFSTFDVEQQEEDDEMLLDRVLQRAPHGWRAEWERAPQAFRTEQGCLTSGQWTIDSRLKLRSPLGTRARFGLDLRQSESDEVRYNYLDLGFFFPTRYGTVGGAFRPLFDKSTQDFLISWEAGADTSALQVRATFGLEDLFNNLWAFRQTRVGDASEPYEQHPFEPGLFAVYRGVDWRLEVEGRWLTPSRKRVPGVLPADPQMFIERWGTLGRIALEARVLGVDWELDAYDHQARETEAPAGEPFGDGENFRRKWSAEAVARHDVMPRLAVEARGIYQDRDQHHAPPTGPGGFGAIDRMVGLEIAWAARPSLRVRAGGLYDRISVAQSGVTFQSSYGTRTESRAHVGLELRFGRVRISGIEGIELDPEPYEIWAVHDKGFLQLQTEF